VAGLVEDAALPVVAHMGGLSHLLLSWLHIYRHTTHCAIFLSSSGIVDGRTVRALGRSTGLAFAAFIFFVTVIMYLSFLPALDHIRAGIFVWGP
jgi:hypothetical protein